MATLSDTLKRKKGSIFDVSDAALDEELRRAEAKYPLTPPPTDLLVGGKYSPQFYSVDLDQTGNLPPEPAPPAPEPDPTPAPVGEGGFPGDDDDSGAETREQQAEQLGGAGAVGTAEQFANALGFGATAAGFGGPLSIGAQTALGTIDPLDPNGNYAVTDPEEWDKLVQENLALGMTPQLAVTAAANDMEGYGPAGRDRSKDPGFASDVSNADKPFGDPDSGITIDRKDPTQGGPGNGGNATKPTSPRATAPGGGLGGGNQGGGSDKDRNAGNDGAGQDAAKGGSRPDGGMGTRAMAKGGIIRNSTAKRMAAAEDAVMGRRYEAGGMIDNGSQSAGAGRFHAAPHEVADDGRVDDEMIMADEGEAVLTRDAAMAYSPRTLEAINDPALAPAIDAMIEAWIDQLSLGGGQRRALTPFDRAGV